MIYEINGNKIELKVNARAILLGDDVLHLRSTITSTNRLKGKNIPKAQLSSNYRKLLDFDYSKPAKYCYHDEYGETVYVSNESDVPREYKSISYRAYKKELSNKNIITVDGNDIVLRIRKLRGKPSVTRYKMVIDTLIELVENKILLYKSKVNNPTHKHLLEAMRKRAERHFTVCKYEFNIFFDYELGKMILDDLNKSGNIEDYDRIHKTTIYLRDQRQKKENIEKMKNGEKRLVAPVKFYDMNGKHNKNMFKLEITITSKQINEHSTEYEDLRKITTWTDVRTISELQFINKKIRTGIKMMVDSLSKNTIKELKDFLEVTKKTDIPRAILEERCTLTELKELKDRVEGYIKIYKN